MLGDNLLNHSQNAIKATRITMWVAFLLYPMHDDPFANTSQLYPSDHKLIHCLVF